MTLAHGAVGGSGPQIEMLIVAGAFIVLGIVFYFQKSVKPSATVVLVIIGIGLAAGAFAFGGGGGEAPDVSLDIAAPADGATVPASEPVRLDVDISGGSLTTATQSNDESEGHLHIFVDGRVVDMPTTNTPDVELEPGEHTITVEFTAADHHSFEPPVTDEIAITAE